MYRNYTFSTASEALPHLLEELLASDEVGSRGGSRVREMTHVGITLADPVKREILVPGRRVNLAAQIAETAWVLAGRNDIDWLSNYLPRAADFSDDGRTWRGGYGPRLRAWPRRDGEGESVIDQLAHVVDLLREDPTSRRAVISLYDPQIDTAHGKDIPCNDMLMFTSRLGRLDLHVVLRSNDAFWGWSGINAFEWSVLQEVVARMLGIEVGSLHFSTNSFHLYDRHWKRANQIVDAPRPLLSSLFSESPRFGKVGGSVEELDELLSDWFDIENEIRKDYQDGFDVDEAIDAFPEPMLRSWLRVLRWWWTGDTDHLAELEGTRIWQATQYSLQPPTRRQPEGPTIEKIKTFDGKTVATVTVEPSDFVKYVSQLHLDKHNAYGDSWKRRGEMLGILANIARKVDRLQGGETADETSADTAIDLMVYLAKYRTWLSEHNLGKPSRVAGTLPHTKFSDDPAYANRLLERVDAQSHPESPSNADFIEAITARFDHLEEVVKADGTRYPLVDLMLEDAFVLARRLWEQEQWKKGNEGRFWKGYEG